MALARKLGSICVLNTPPKDYPRSHVTKLDLEKLVEKCLPCVCDAQACFPPWCAECNSQRACLQEIRAVLAVVEKEARRV